MACQPWAVELLVSQSFHEDAVSRAYDAILHPAKAALFVHNVVATSHAAVRRLFGQPLINTDEIERQWSSHLGESLDDCCPQAHSVHSLPSF